MKRSSWLIMLTVTAVALGILAGCGGSSDQVIATVNGYDITVEEYTDFTRNNRTPYASAEDEFNGKRILLDSLIISRLLIDAAYDVGLQNDVEIGRLVAANSNPFMLDVLYQRQIADKATASEAEIRDLYDRLEFQVRASHILVDSLDTANALLERILAGESFEQLAFEYSTDQSAKRNKGDLGFFLWGNMVGEFQEAAFVLEPGEVSAPVKTQYGYHLIKLVDKQPNEARGDFEATKSELKEQLLSMKRRIEGQAFMEVINEKYKVTVDVNTIEYVTHKREMLYPPQVLERLPKSEFDTEQLDRDEQQLPMATWDGGQMTLMEYLVALKEVPQQFRPDLDDADSLATIIFRMKSNDFLVSEAYQLGMENDPEFQRKVRLFKELNMAAAMRDDSLPQPLPPDEAAIRQYYEEHKNQFVDSAQIHVHEILLSDELLANRLVEEIKTLEEFKAKAMELTERPAKRGTNGDLGYIQQRWFPEIFEAAGRTDVGKVGGPVVNAGNRYSIFWVVDRVDEVQRQFLDVKDGVRRILIGQYKQTALEEWIDAQRANANISVNEDALWEQVDQSQYEQAVTEQAG